MSYKRHRKKQLYEDWRAPVIAGVCFAYILMVMLIEKQYTKKARTVNATLSEVKQSSRIRNDNPEKTLMMTYDYTVGGNHYHYYDYIGLQDNQLPDSLMEDLKVNQFSRTLYYNPDYPDESSFDATLCIDPPVKNLTVYFLGFFLVAGGSYTYLKIKGGPNKNPQSGDNNANAGIATNSIKT